ncbi:MAG: hypothetical protein ACLUCI_11755 [Blautia hansenii]
MENGFNLKKWENAFLHFDKNKTNMEAKLHIRVQEGKIVVTVSSMKDEYLKYKEELERLAFTIAQGAYVIAFNSLCKPTYPEADDYEDEAAKGRKCLFENIIMYTRTLFSQGLEAFYCLLVTQKHLFECAYQIQHMRYDGDKWVNIKGEYLEDGSWTSPDGNKFYCNMSASVLEAIIH